MSTAQVSVDSVNITALANNVVSHLVNKKRGTKENKFETMEGICVDDGTLDAPDGPLHAATTPCRYQEAPSMWNDVVDFLGIRTGSGRKSNTALVTLAMLEVVDELDEKKEVWQLFLTLDIPREMEYETFCDVAMGMFQHGITWGKIAVLFMFAAHCVLKAMLSELPNILVTICSFLARLIDERCVHQWIEDHGGWESLLNISSGPLVFAGMVVAGIVGGFLVKVAMDRLAL